MNESSLAKSIDRLAEKRAKDILTNVRAAIENALKPHWRPKDASEEWIGEDIKELLRNYINSIGEGGWNKGTPPSQELIDACRAKVLSELLNGLPKLGELVQLAEQPDYE